MSGAIVKTISGLDKVKDRSSATKELAEMATKARSWYMHHTQWTVTVTSTDRLYDLVHMWFTDLSLQQARPPRTLEAKFERRSMYDNPVLEGTAAPTVRYYYDGTQMRTVTVAGHVIKVALHKRGSSPQAKDGPDKSASIGELVEPDQLTFYARTQAGQTAVKQMLESLATVQEKRKPGLWMLNRWGSWTRRDDIPPRPLNTVVLKAGQLERIHADIARFLDSEADYVKRGIPWHRGILLEGEPGTGKTSAIAAIAADLKLDLWYAPLGDLEQDTSLLNIISEVRPRSILLLEDVDVFHAARERDDIDKKASMAGLLNALDGVSTPHGMISIMTSNQKNVIDRALIRPGRVDLTEHIGMPDEDQIKRLFEAFYEYYPIETVPGSKKLSTAAYMEIFKKHMNDPIGALREMEKN